MSTKSDLEKAATLVHQYMQPTPQYQWPVLSDAVGCETWVKHENHGPTGAFKARGGITYIDWLKRTHPEFNAIVTATRGNHGQSQALAATRAGLDAHIYVPYGNSAEKNKAMQAFGANLVEFGSDFDEARLEAGRKANEMGWHPVPAFHTELLRGVATYAYELFSTAPDLDTVYVPIGCGSGICGTILARDALNLKTKIVGVVSDQAMGAKLSMETGSIIETNSANTFADGMAVRVPVAAALEIYAKGVDRIIAVSEFEIAQAMRLYFRSIHHVAEGAGAASLAGLMQEKDRMKGKRVGVILSGCNIDSDKFSEVLQGNTPAP